MSRSSERALPGGWTVIRKLGRYILLEQVGTGGMAAVYRGHDSALDREVAVKVLHPHLASRPESRARFSREARAVARLSHPSILEIYDYSGDGAAESFLVTEFVRGRTLREFQREVGFGFPELGLLVGRALADALVHAHAAGVIHRDLKPENVLVEEGERAGIKLADFGIARILSSDERLTMTGALVGSPHHMAPEILEGREADARSDLFSLGTLLYWLATGALPFAAPNPTAILRRLLEGAYEDPRRVDPRVSDELAALVARLLAVDPSDRPSSALEVRDALDAMLAEVGIERPDEALRAFLGGAGDYKAAFPARAAAALRTRIEGALAARRVPRALAGIARVLALDPHDEWARRQLASLTARRRSRRQAAAVATALLLVGVAIAAARLLPRPTPGATIVAAEMERGAQPPSTGPVDPVRSAPSEAAASPSLPSPRPSAPAARPSARPPERGRTGPEATPSAQLEIHVRPYAQRALLDGAEVAAGVQIVRVEIRPDHPHLIQIEHPCCFPFARAFTTAEAAALGQLRVPLQPRPARLRVDGPASTLVNVGGRALGTAADSQRTPFEVAVPPGESAYEGTVRVDLVPPGAAPRSVDLKLKAGADVVVAVPRVETSP